MEVLLVYGSPRKGGCTHAAPQLVGEALGGEGVGADGFWAGKGHARRGGAQVMQVLGRNMARLLKSIEADRAAGVEPPAPVGRRVSTSFIR